MKSFCLTSELWLDSDDEEEDEEEEDAICWGVSRAGLTCRTKRTGLQGPGGSTGLKIQKDQDQSKLTEPQEHRTFLQNPKGTEPKLQVLQKNSCCSNTKNQTVEIAADV